MREGVVANSRLDPLDACALRIADDAGWVPVLVTNGATRQQDGTIRRTGLDRYVADWVISEEVGVSKPNPRIFELAAQRVRMRLQRRLGDRRQPGGRHRRRRGRDGPAQRLAAPRPRSWMESRFAPTATAAGVIPAVAAVLARIITLAAPGFRPGDSAEVGTRPGRA